MYLDFPQKSRTCFHANSVRASSRGRRSPSAKISFSATLRFLIFLVGAGIFFLPCLRAQQSAPSPQVSQEAGRTKRIPRQQALTTSALEGVVREQIAGVPPRPIAAANISLTQLQTGQHISAVTSAEGVFRIVPLEPGNYLLQVQSENYSPFQVDSLTLNANEVVTLEIFLVATPNTALSSRLPRQPDLGPPVVAEAVGNLGTYREFRHRLDSDPNYIAELAPEVLPPVADVFNT